MNVENILIIQMWEFSPQFLGQKAELEEYLQVTALIIRLLR
jgi:hypothetical protein